VQLLEEKLVVGEEDSGAMNCKQYANSNSRIGYTYQDGRSPQFANNHEKINVKNLIEASVEVVEDGMPTMVY